MFSWRTFEFLWRKKLPISIIFDFITLLRMTLSLSLSLGLSLSLRPSVHAQFCLLQSNLIWKRWGWLRRRLCKVQRRLGADISNSTPHFDSSASPFPVFLQVPLIPSSTTGVKIKKNGNLNCPLKTSKMVLSLPMEGVNEKKNLLNGIYLQNSVYFTFLTSKVHIY